MRYKVLLTGKNNTAIDDFFTQMNESFEILSTSSRYEDISNHLKYFHPDILVYCLDQDNNEYLNKMISFKERLIKSNIPLAIIGSEEACNNFSKYATNFANLVLVKPITASSIENKISVYLTEQQLLAKEAARIREEQLAEAEQKRLEEERLAREKASLRKHILVVDDDPLMLKLVKEHLRDKYDVATATNGKTALKFLEKKKTNLILLDYEMPGEDGPAILEKLHANDATRDIPVVFLTGITERDKIQKALVQKPQGYLLKPIDRDKLLEIIAKFAG